MASGRGHLLAARRLGLIALTVLTLVSLVPTGARGQLTGPYGTPQLQLISVKLANVTYSPGARSVGAARFWVEGQAYLGGQYYYVNSSTAEFNQTFVSRSSNSGYGYGTNGSASASASASAVAGENATAVVTEQSQVPAPVELYGYATFYFAGGGTLTEGLSFSGGRPAGPGGSRELFYVGNTSSFESVEVSAPYGDQEAYPLYATVYIEMVNPYTNETVGAPAQAFASSSSSPVPVIDLYNTVVALPQFNDTMLGAWASGPSQAFPALPLAPYYNMMAAAGIIALVPLALADALTPDRGGLMGALVKSAAGVIVILAFPFVYDHVAYMMNYLNQMVIAYPLPYQYYGARLALLEGWMVFPASMGLASLLYTGALLLGYAVATAIIWIMSFILGTVRILLIAGMVALFPLSVALRDFRYTSKLGRMVEDTLFGLMLATLLSASMLGIADYLLQSWGSADNMFRLAGIQPQWVAISAVLGALLAPTVLAPLASTVYMAATDVSAVAGGVAAALWTGVTGGAAQGATAGAGPAGALKGAVYGAGSAAVSIPRSVVTQYAPSGAMARHESMLVRSFGRALGVQ